MIRQLSFHRHARACYCWFLATPPSSIPVLPDSLFSSPRLAFGDLSLNRSSHALAWANIDVLGLYDFAHDKDSGVFG